MKKMKENLDNWIAAEDIAFNNSAAELTYKKRATRIANTIQLKKPDRVPVLPSFNMFPAFYSGISCEEAQFDYEKSAHAWLKTATDFNPDAMVPTAAGLCGGGLKTLGYNPLKFPGKDIRPDFIYQFDEREFVEAEEFYTWYLNDPSDFMLRRFLPEVCDPLKSLRNLPELTSMLSYSNGLLEGSLLFAEDGVIEALECLVAAGKETKTYLEILGNTSRKLKSMGIPNLQGGICSAPFDAIGDWFRGTYGIMTDLYRYPEQLKAVMEKRVSVEVKFAIEQAKLSSSPTVAMMLHKGSKKFLTRTQFEEFYWPTLKEVMLRLIDAGYIPMPFFEGNYNGRLEILKEIPKGKAVYCFEEVDIYEAQKVLGDHICFRGNIPNSMMQLGEPAQVRAYVKELITVFGKEGGLIVDCGMWLDQAKPENLRAMIDATHEFG